LTGSPSAADARAWSESTRSYLGRRPAAGRTSSGRAEHQSGQGLIEYGLILVLMAVVCVVSLLFFGDQLSTLLNLVTSAV
jgi:Flp pilus assembly pilin Flp